MGSSTPLRGLLRVIDSAQMERLHQGALRVLETTGLQIRGQFLLEALADAGCKVDFARQRAWFKPDLVERQVAAQRNRYRMVRSSLWYPFCREMPEGDVSRPDEWTVDFGYGAPVIYDYPSGTYRAPTVQDQAEMIRLGNALPEAKAICAPFVCGDVDPRIETIESSRILLRNTRKPGWVGTSSGAEVKYLAEFAALAADHNPTVLREQPPIFVHAYCTTSPLKLDTRACDVLKEALRYKFPVNFAPMPILGATTPVTPAGAVIVATAEILGCMTAATLIDPDVYYYASGISGEMDMKTTQVCYAAPAAILTDAALHQLFRDKYGIVLNVETGYVEAKSPGMQASFMKAFRQMAFGCTVSTSLPIGLLDNGSVFSPVQAMLDLEMNQAQYKFGRGIEVSDETMCIDLINELEFCETSTYLENEHTFRHFRDVLWVTRMFDRTYRNGDIAPHQEDRCLLEKADKAWRDLVSRQKPLEVDSRFAAELDRIVEAAKAELLA
ncbi:MAG TPA: trimethylamine methyltransferase family protein [Bryobacteraceae bacterium]|nr:trimethylamine methyltransferase family protein [Bryobacteraceae bacterium]